MIREDILERLFPGYIETNRILESHSNWELNLLTDNMSDYPEDLENSIIKEVQWKIANILFSQFITNWDDFISNNESIVMDYCYDDTFLSYDYENNSYLISKEPIINLCEVLLNEADGEYSINENIDFRNVISDLNKYYPIKFCKA